VVPRKYLDKYVWWWVMVWWFVAVQHVMLESCAWSCVLVLFPVFCACFRTCPWVVCIRWLSTTLNVLQLTPPGLTFIFQLAKRDRVWRRWMGGPYVIFACFMLVTIHLICKCSFVADISNTFSHSCKTNQRRAIWLDFPPRILPTPLSPFPFPRWSVSVTPVTSAGCCIVNWCAAELQKSVKRKANWRKARPLNKWNVIEACGNQSRTKLKWKHNSTRSKWHGWGGVEGGGMRIWGYVPY